MCKLTQSHLHDSIKHVKINLMQMLLALPFKIMILGLGCSSSLRNLAFELSSIISTGKARVEGETKLQMLCSAVDSANKRF